MTNVNRITGKTDATASSFLELQLLGAPQLRLNAQSLHHLLTGKPLALLLYLAVTGQPHTRDVLATLLWSELSIQQARNNLRYVLPILRRVVAPYVSITKQTISFNRQAAYWQDVEVLRTTLQDNLSVVETEQLQSALALYQGEFLAGFRVRNAPAFVAWQSAQRQQLYTLTLQGWLHLAERQLARQDHAASQITRQRLSALAPHPSSDLLTVLAQSGIDLTPYQALIPWLKAGETRQVGAQASAGQLYTIAYSDSTDQQPTAKMTDAEAAPPSAIKFEQHESLLNRLMDSFISHNLPTQLTPFFGRQQEISDIIAHLAKATYRLLTLTGEGGIGKTRLALALAQSIVDCELQQAEFIHHRQSTSPAVICNLQFRDGIWFVPLAHVVATADLPNQVATAIAKAIQLPLNAQEKPTAQIIHYFVDKRSLLILDNFEHVSASIDFILELLQATTALKLLITSRHRLNIQAEYPWRLDGLPIPPHTSFAIICEAPHEYPGVALFVERARRAHPGFQLAADNLSAVIQICHFVQGLPLGIELAAALTKEYTCTELWDILRHNYNILTTTLPDLPMRHRNIRVVFNHSWRFLNEEEARVLASCSVFCGAFDREAAMAVTGASPTILAGLIDQSLIHCRTEAMGRRWLHLHELVRQYAAEQLAALPHAQRQAQAQHAAYYMAQLQQVETLLQQQQPLSPSIDHHLANFRAAWLWCSHMQEWTLLEQGLWGLLRLCRLVGIYNDAYQLLQVTIKTVRSALPSTPDRQQTCLLAHLLNGAAEFCRHLSWVEEGERLAQEALELGRLLADAACQSQAYNELAHLAQRAGQHMLMRTLAQQAFHLAQQAQVARLMAKSLSTLGAAETLCGNLMESNICYAQALEHLHAAPDPELEAVIRGNLAAGYIRGQHYAMARHNLQQALAIHQALNTPLKSGTIYVFSGILYTAVGAYEQAWQHYQQALHIYKEVYEPYWQSWTHIGLAYLLQIRGQLTEAMTTCERVLRLVQGKIPLLEHCILTHLGNIYSSQGNWIAAEQHYQQALILQKKANLHLHLAEPAVQLAQMHLQHHQAALAQAILAETLTILKQYGPSAVAEPFVAYWIGYQVLKATADPGVHIFLQEAYEKLQAVAAAIDEPAMRQTFLEHVTVNRMLIDAVHAARIAHTTIAVTRSAAPQ